MDFPPRHPDFHSHAYQYRAIGQYNYYTHVHVHNDAAHDHPYMDAMEAMALDQQGFSMKRPAWRFVGGSAKGADY